jgi:hypothetical protein
MSTNFEREREWAGGGGLSSGALSQLQRFIQPLRTG